MKAKFYKYFIENDYISENELNGVFHDQYNDIFHKILKFDQNKIMALLQKQVYLHLKLINKKVDDSLFQKTLSNYLEKYLDDKEKVVNTFKIIKKYPNQIIYLEYLNCFIHCTKCKNALHRCGSKFIVFNDYVFCISCKEVYNEFQVHMYCKECKEEYFTKLREIINEKQAHYFPAAYKRYHCPILGLDEKIKCIKCKNDLYLNINSEKNKNKINEIFCKKCKIIYDVNKINNICVNCKKNFKSQVKIYNFFSSIKLDLLCVIHSLYNQKNALSFIIANRQCNCNLSKIEKLKHSDGGDLLEGNKLGKKVIICNKCFGLFNLNCFDWACPICKKVIDIKKINIIEYKGKESAHNSAKNHRNTKSLFDFQNKNKYNYNSPLLKRLQKNKRKQNISHSKYFSSNNSIKKNCNINNSLIIKSNRSVSYFPGKDYYLLRTDLKKHPKIDLSVKINTKNMLKKELFNKKLYDYFTDNTSTFNKTNDDFDQITEKKSKVHKRERTNINLKKISFGNSTDYRNTLYNNFNKDKCKDNFINIKKKLFDNDSKDKEKKRIIRKNNSVTNNISIKNKKDNNIILTTRSMIKYRLEQIKANTNNIKDIIKKTSLSANKNNGKKDINKINTFMNKLISKNNNIKNKFVKIYKNKNNSNNININIKINNSNNNIININNNYFNEKIKNLKNNNIKKGFIKNERLKANYFSNNKDKNQKNINQKQNNLNNSQKKKLNYSKIKNCKLFISEISNSNNSKKNNDLLRKKIIVTENNINKKKLSLSQNFQIKNKKLIFENSLQKKKILSKNNTNNSKFHSDDYNIINLIGEGTYGKIYLVKNPKTNEKYALKQISLNNKIEINNHKKQFELLMKLAEENPELNIIKILGIEVKQLDKFNTVLYILMEAGKSDWEKEVYQRNLEQRYYKEEELMEILTSLVATFSSLQGKGISHRDVKPQNIVYFEKNEKRSKSIYKITDFGEAKINKSNKILLYDNFEKDTSKQTVRGTELYMSPILFNALRNTGEIDIKYNPYKSDVYSLGLCILLAASLSYIPLYKIREINNIDTVKNIIEGYLNHIYSQKFIKLILIMLQINEKYRPDFIELNSLIYNHYFCQ